MGNKFKLTLLAAGLGRKKLMFGNRRDAPTFKRKMEDAYPKLKEGSGFELLRSGARPGELLLIKPVEGTNVITGHKCNEGHKCNNIWSQM